MQLENNCLVSYLTDDGFLLRRNMLQKNLTIYKLSFES